MIAKRLHNGIGQKRRRFRPVGRSLDTHRSAVERLCETQPLAQQLRTRHLLCPAKAGDCWSSGSNLFRRVRNSSRNEGAPRSAARSMRAICAARSRTIVEAISLRRSGGKTCMDAVAPYWGGTREAYVVPTIPPSSVKPARRPQRRLRRGNCIGSLSGFGTAADADASDADGSLIDVASRLACNASRTAFIRPCISAFGSTRSLCSASSRSCLRRSNASRRL